MFRNLIKPIAVGATLVAATAGYAQSGYRPGLLGVDTNLRPNPAYMGPSSAPSMPRSAPSTPAPSRGMGIPESFRVPMPNPARSQFQRAIENPPARSQKPVPPAITYDPVKIETHGDKTTVGTDIKVVDHRHPTRSPHPWLQRQLAYQRLARSARARE